MKTILDHSVLLGVRHTCMVPLCTAISPVFSNLDSPVNFPGDDDSKTETYSTVHRRSRPRSEVADAKYGSATNGEWRLGVAQHLLIKTKIRVLAQLCRKCGVDVRQEEVHFRRYLFKKCSGFDDIGENRATMGIVCSYVSALGWKTSLLGLHATGHDVEEWEFISYAEFFRMK